MSKEKTIAVFEVCYQDHNNQQIVVPVSAEMFRIRDGHIIFGSEVEDTHAFRHWTSVRKMSSREIAQPSPEFTQTQLELIKKKRPV